MDEGTATVIWLLKLADTCDTPPALFMLRMTNHVPPHKEEAGSLFCRKEEAKALRCENQLRRNR